MGKICVTISKDSRQNNDFTFYIMLLYYHPIIMITNLLSGQGRF